jgi:hypothetical protein
MPLLYLAKFSPALEILGLKDRLPQSAFAIFATMLLGAINYKLVESRFRVPKIQTQKNSLRVLPVVFLTFLLPVIMFLGLHHGSRNGYWGLDENLTKPAYAGDLDPNCLRDSEIGPPCSYLINRSVKSVLLIGDSHAGHISQAVIDAASSKGWNTFVWTHSACPVVFNQGSERIVSDNCLNINNTMKKWVKRNKPTQIIISQYVKDNGLQNHLRDAVIDLKAMVSKVLIIENTPVFPDGKDFMVSRPIIMEPYIPPKTYKLSEMELTDVASSNNFARWARSQGVVTINLNSIFCNLDICSRYKNGYWLFRDENHFSVEGARLVIPLLKDYF